MITFRPANVSAALMSLILAASLGGVSATTAQANPSETSRVFVSPHAVSYQTVNIDGVEVFYREAGDVANPTVLLLHGFPSSSQMFRNLIPQLATRYHVVAPDYPGFGQSAMPDRDKFEYSFDNYARIVDRLTTELDLDSYALYVMDYGAPVGYRLATSNPDKVTADRKSVV